MPGKTATSDPGGREAHARLLNTLGGRSSKRRDRARSDPGPYARGTAFPAPRAHVLQSLARADTGGVLALGYSAMRGYGNAHPTVNELRLAEAEVRVQHPRGTVSPRPCAVRDHLSQCT